MPKLVVHSFEMIDIKHQQSTRHSIATPSLDLTSESNAETPAISQSRQRIKISVRAQQIDLLSQQHQLLRSLNQQIELVRQREVIKSTFNHGAISQADSRMFGSGQQQRNSIF